MIDLNLMERAIRARCQELAGQRLAGYREFVTVGSDRDLISFMLEWQTEEGSSEHVTVDIDHGRLGLSCRLKDGVTIEGEQALDWLDALLEHLRPRPAASSHGPAWMGQPAAAVEGCSGKAGVAAR